MTIPWAKWLRSRYTLFDEPMRKGLAGLLALTVTNAATECLGVSMLLPLIQVLSNSDQAMPGTLTRLLPNGIDQTTTIFLIVAGTLVVFIAKAMVAMSLAYVQYRFIWDGRTRLATRLMERYLGAPYEQVLVRSTSTMLRNCTSAVVEVLSGSVLSLIQLAAEVVVVIAMLGLLLAVEPATALSGMAVMGGVMIVYMRLARAKLKELGQRGNTGSRTMIGTASGSLSALREIKLAQGEERFSQRFRALVAEHSDAQWRYAMITASPRQVLEILLVLSIMGTVTLFLWLNRPLAEVLPALALFGGAAFRLMPSINRIATYAHSLQYGSATLDELIGELALEPCPRRDGPPLPIEWRELMLLGVGYSYPGSAKTVLDQINLTIPRGKSVALIGPSGSGKTTLANIISGLLPATTGTVLLDGAVIEPGSRAWQHRIGYVPQDVVLLDDTLAANVAFGEESIAPQRLARAIRLAQLEALVAELPQGIHTQVGERGKALSGGQRQRLGIARALYRDAEVLILDEATSALDAETEASVTEAIHALSGTCTLIIIAHRLSTVRNSDNLILLADGRVADSGTFAELNQRNEVFARMVHHMDLSSALNTAKP